MGGMMQHVADGFTVAAVLAGLWAAWLWWQSGRVGIDPKWNLPEKTSSPNPSLENVKQGLLDLLDPGRSQAFSDAVDLSSRLNGRAAIWTAASVAAQAIATVFGRLAMPG